jgi:hypothetical protein
VKKTKVARVDARVVPTRAHPHAFPGDVVTVIPAKPLGHKLCTRV